MGELPSWAGAKRVCVDCETRDTHLTELGCGVRRGGYITGVSFAIEDGPKHYLPIRHEGGDNLDADQVLAYLREQGATFKGEIVGAHLPYDLDYLWQEEVHFPEVEYYRDIQIADPLIDELQFSYSLDKIAKRYGLEGKREDLLREAAAAYGIDPKKGMWRLPARFVGAYAEQDADQPLKVLRRQERIIDDRDLWEIYNLESQVLPVLVRMRRRGVLIDQDKLAEIEDWSLKEEAKALATVHRETGVKINVGDVWKGDALVPALEHIGLTLTTTASGKKSVSKDVFASVDHPVTKALAWARKTNKLRTTFAASIRRYMVNGRIHCTFNQMAQEDDKGEQKGARYGRLSATDPNLQQQPSRDEFAPMWRSIYLPEPDTEWASCDYCFSDDTEVLTETGFKLFKDLQKSERLAQWEGGRITYTHPLEYQRVLYKGDMIHVRGDRQVDLLVSPNHNCMLQSIAGQAFTIKADQYREVSAYQVQAGEAEGANTEDKALLQVVVAIQADGSERVANYRVWLKKPRKIERLRTILRAAGLSFHETFCEDKAAGHGFVIAYSERISLYLQPGKKFCMQSLMSLTPECRSAFLDELELWDGSQSGHYYCSTNQHNVELVQHMGAVTNRRCNLTSRELPFGKILWSATLTKRTRTWAEKFTTTNESYDGEIFCVTMPQHTVIVRRNGRVSVTAQSQQEPRWTTHFAAVMDLEGAREAAQAYHDDPTLDNHQFMADLTGLPRKQAKDVYLGLCYGEGGAKLCDDLGGLPKRWALSIGKKWPREIIYFDEDQHEAALAEAKNHEKTFLWLAAGEEGQRIIDKFDERAPFIRQAAKRATKRAEKVGQVVTICGRQLHFKQRDDGSYQYLHKAFNRVIQGSSADQMKKAMVEIDRQGYWMMLQVHDETANSVESRRQADEIAEIMSNIILARVPFRVDVEIGPSWGEAK